MKSWFGFGSKWTKQQGHTGEVVEEEEVQGEEEEYFTDLMNQFDQELEAANAADYYLDGERLAKRLTLMKKYGKSYKEIVANELQETKTQCAELEEQLLL
jgi:hypothetical protein